jgi:hypothetical protein
MRNLQIEQTPIHALRPHRQNARTHSKRQLRQIANSIRRFGFCNAILVDDDLTILACPFRKSYPDILVMQPSQDWNDDDGASPLDGSMQGRIFL